MRDGGVVRLTTTVPPNGDVRVVHASMQDASVLVLRTRNGVYRAVACAADSVSRRGRADDRNPFARWPRHRRNPFTR